LENRIAWLVMLLMLMGGCAALKDQQRVQNPVPYESYAVLRAGIVKDYGRKIPQEWGETLLGVKTDLATDLPVMALTFDACGGACGSGYDAELIDFLERQQVPATLFMNGRWIDRHWDIVRELSDNPLFEIENHGRMHKPCSVSGRAAYGIPGTAGVAELVDEVEINARMIEALTGSKPRYYRPGTAYCDEIGVQVVHDLGYEVAGYNVLGDAGATYSCDQVREALLAAPPGAIVLMHMNHPDSGTREGLMQAIPLLKQRGVRFIRLCEYYPPFNPETAVASESSRKENNQPGW
jgi:peptidoglycan/xylan/chitin deacetylase (PgdA/CDA1 family)